MGSSDLCYSRHCPINSIAISMSREFEQVKAPWSTEQVANLNEFQSLALMHPFTCGQCRADLRATEDGWVCDHCGGGVVQDWAWDHMADGSIRTHPVYNIQKSKIIARKYKK